MGKLSNQNFWRLPNQIPGGTLQPIGALEAHRGATATDIRKDADGFWYYSTDEIPVKLWPNRFLEVDVPDGHLIWMGLEVKTDDIALRGRHFAFSLEPYSLNWFGHAPFRRAAKTKADMQRALRKAQQKLGDLPSALQAITWDPFETNRKFLTARLTSPIRINWADAKALDEQYTFGRTINYAFGVNSAHHKPNWIFGICDDFNQAAADLKRECLTDLKLYRQLVMEPLDLFESALHGAIQQALAGRKGGDKKKRVAYKVIDILRNHMEAASKRSGSIPR